MSRSPDTPIPRSTTTRARYLDERMREVTRQPTITVTDIRQRVEEIRRHVRDPEKAHSLEDDLWEDVLLAIATMPYSTDSSQAIDLAEACLETLRIDFPRWSA